MVGISSRVTATWKEPSGRACSSGGVVNLVAN
jgi:hypothetical protein